MQELAPNSRHTSLSGTAVKQSSEGSRNLVCTLATIRRCEHMSPGAARGGGAADALDTRPPLAPLLRQFNARSRLGRPTTADL